MPKKDGTPTKAESDRALKAKNRAYRARKKAQGKVLDPSGRAVAKTPFRDEPMKQFEEEVRVSNNESEMKEALKQSGNAKMIELYTYLQTYPRHTLSLACRRSNVSLQELNDLWRKHQFARGLIKVSDQLPEILEDTAIDARSRFDVCDFCDGTGEKTRTRIIDGGPVTETEICPKCKGAREIRLPGDAESRKQIFEMTGLTGKTSPLVAIQQNTFIGDTLDDTLSAAQKILTGPVIDVEAENATED